MTRIRPAAVQGSFYPAGAEKLRDLLRECFNSSSLGPRGTRSLCPSLFGGMVPHAGYIYSGPCAAHFYSNLAPDIQRVILLGVNHQGRGARVALSPADCWQTPLGRVEIDQELGRWLQTQTGFIEYDEQPHLQEHSIEVQLPFLQSVLSDFTLLPLSLSYLSEEECAQLGQALARVYERATAAKRTVIIASSDLSHYLSPEETERLDRLALEPVLALDPSGLLKTVAEESISMCGVFPTAVFLFAAKALGAKQVRLLKHCHSGDAVPMKEVVGYASVTVEL
ncbi:MAG: AmmeMemoRadiSam system protein B [Deltaproteobacteria bacterium]|nr:MAG: AmmeMemoRadiSam system protein B [Deltaproteobacteria bacterium]